jgi:hypothetical protein
MPDFMYGFNKSHQIAESVTGDVSNVTEVYQHARNAQRRTFGALAMG